MVDDEVDVGVARRRRSARHATESFAEALARAEDPTRPELPGAADAAAALAALRAESMADLAVTDAAVLSTMVRRIPLAEFRLFATAVLTLTHSGFIARAAIERKEWDRRLGPPPGKRGCLMPAHLITSELINAVGKGAAPCRTQPTSARPTSTSASAMRSNN